MENTNRHAEDAPLPAEPLQWGDAPALDLVALKRFAKSAPPGPWHVSPHHFVDSDTDRIAAIFAGFATESAAYIAAANPKAILALLDRLERAERLNDECGKLCQLLDLRIKELESGATKAWSGELPPLPANAPCSDVQHGLLYTTGQVLEYGRSSVGAALDAAGQACDFQATWWKGEHEDEDNSDRIRNDMRERMLSAQQCAKAIRALNKLAPDGAAQVGARELPHPEITPMFLLNAALCIEEEHSVPQHKKDAIVAKLNRLADELGEVSAPGMPPQSARDLPFRKWSKEAEILAPQSAVAVPQPEGNSHDWMMDGSLLYRLSDEGANCDEINVTMSHGSRGKDQREAAAAGLLNIICTYPGVLEAAAPTDAEPKSLGDLLMPKAKRDEIAARQGTEGPRDE